ncbi:MAG TPA: sialidase family protein, partial [Thermoanaerobaculia bacterium]|nr:sialidase family protein [Thermoanaerobaculia bacterium]
MSALLLVPPANRRVTVSTLPADRSESVLVADPADPLHLVGASKRFFDPAKYSFTLATYASFDGGISWQEAPPIQLPGWDGASDPALAWDGAGNVYLVALPFTGVGNTVGIAVYKSTDGGRTWGVPQVIHTSSGDDKQWAAGDTSPTSPHRGNLYAVWVDSELGFARSSDGGATWKGTAAGGKDQRAGSSPFPADDSALFSSPELSVAADGTIYIVWYDEINKAIRFGRSTDGGATFTAPRDVAKPVAQCPDTMPGGLFRTVTGPTGCTAGAGLVVFAWPDNSQGVARIFYRRSTDGGAAWLGSPAGDPLLTGAAASAADQQEFFPQVISMPGGEIGCAFYEFGPKGPAGKRLIDVVLAVSTDRGATFPHRLTVTEEPWDPTVAEVLLPVPQKRTFIGDYFGLEATRLGFFPFWTDTRTGVQEIFAARVAVGGGLLVRDAVDDDGTPGAVAWGGRSPDILVAPAGVDPAAAFADLADPAPGGDLGVGANRIFVRVHNRGPAPASAAVDLYFAPADAPWSWPDPAHRIAAAVAVADIDPGGFKFTPEIAWTPAPGPPGYVLVALARPAGAP